MFYNIFNLLDACKQALVSGTELNVTTDKITVSSKWRPQDSLDDARLNKNQARYKPYFLS